MVEISQDSTYDNLWKAFSLYYYDYGLSNGAYRYLDRGKDTVLFPTGIGGFLLDIGLNPKPDPPPLAATEINQYKELNVYPNPATGKLHIGGMGKQEPYFITDITGKVLISGKSDHGVIDVSMLSPGLYLLKTKYQTLKFIKA